ncbi:MAG: Na+/H+ antiporter [Chitinophagaceae bacterium]|nr:MAG: Na+/H+ antiporter [Chitinophagaceae bacterium]
MENYSIVLFILALMIGLSALADKIKLPYPVLLISAGIAIGFIPGMPPIELDPEVIFLIFLPPLLYDAAFNMDFTQFKTHFNTISTLAVSLVFLTTTAIAVAAYYIIPGLTWPTAFVLGSILSATDAVSAISITKGLNIGHKTSVILEGESLVNDASALIAYRFAVAAVSGTAFVFWKASVDFVVSIAGGLLIGAILGRLLVWILMHTRKNSLVTISFMLLMPFIAYQIAEEFHVSGVIAVVILGLSIAYFSNRMFTNELKIQSKSFWDIIIFLLNGLIFILIGLQFPNVAAKLSGTQIWTYIIYAFVITVVALVIRFARVFFHQRQLLRLLNSKRGRVTESALLDMKTSVIISWSGMRGIVSLATAIALPMKTLNDERFPNRSEIIFISIVVVLFTIIGQGSTLPWIVKRLDARDALKDGHLKV